MRAKISVQPRYARPNPNGLQSLTHNVPTYVKLQQAYVSESGENYGDFNIIGYQAPGEKGSAGEDSSKTTNFAYIGGGTYTEGSAKLEASEVETWFAVARVKLNDCAAGKKWSVTVQSAGSGAAGADAVKFVAYVPEKSSKDVNCQALTPSFDKIGK